jgi:hypothetical protein
VFVFSPGAFHTNILPEFAIDNVPEAVSERSDVNKTGFVTAQSTVLPQRDAPTAIAHVPPLAPPEGVILPVGSATQADPFQLGVPPVHTDTVVVACPEPDALLQVST